MKVVYDAETDTLDIILNENPIAESDEDKPGVIIDYDKDGSIVSLEVLDASKHVMQPTRMVYESEPMKKAS
ncbi:MAG: hypothetical protein A2293_01560 [Elusimicrobia bacterium RIFOXYB2_FULL_49_7]|nr:MAG: hypothetical protein A2293_01560 [Elusimicrobia bacterium RIFOXYB2_FULL_49_7]